MYTRLVTKIVITLCIVFVCRTNTLAQLTYSFERINTENGLSTNALKGIIFDDANRFLWIATESGLLRYNGHGFQTFGDANSNSKLNSRIINIVKKQDNSIFGTVEDASVFAINKNKVEYGIEKRTIRWADEMLGFMYNSKLVNKSKENNSINFPLLKYQDKFFQLDGNQLVLYDKDSTRIVKNKFKNSSIFVLNNELFTINTSAIVNKIEFSSYDAKGIIIKSFKAVGAPVMPNRFNGKQFKLFQNFSNANAYILLNDNIYELLYIDGRIQFELKIPSVPASDYIRYFQFDKATNTAYLATDNRGLIIAHPQYFVRKQPFNLNAINSASSYAQVEMLNGNIQLNSGALFGSKIKSETKYFDILSDPRTYITSDSVFLYTNYLGVTAYSIKSKKHTNLTSDPFFSRSVFLEVGDSVFLFSYMGIGVFNNTKNIKKLYTYGVMPGTFDVYDAVLYDDHTVLVATSAGLYSYSLRSNQIKLIFKDPLGAHFRTIYKHKNYFLIGTYGGGIYILFEGIIKPLALDKNNYLKFSHCFIPNKSDVWISTNKGIIKSTFESIISNYNNKKIVPKYKYYGKQEGIDILEMNGGCTPCAIKLSDGKISIPGIDGLVQFNPNVLPNEKITPNVYIDKYKLDEFFIDEFQFNNASISNEIDVVQLILGVSGLVSEENIILEYEIDKKKTWRKVALKNPVIYIENPRAGDHLLTIRWKNTDASGWNYKYVKYTISYAWYAHPYMYFGYFILLILIILLYVKIKTFIYKRRQNELEIEVTAKTKNLQDINFYLTERNQAKDQVIAIMNHDILTPLKYLHITASNLESNLIDTDAAKPIGQIKSTAKELEYLTSNLLSWVKFDTINQLDHKQSIDIKILIDSIIEFVLPFKYSDQVIIYNNVPTGTIINSWHDPMRVLFYNLLMNSIKSTLTGRIIVSSELVENKFVLSVMDEGTGMNEAMVHYLLTGIKSETQFISSKYKKGNGVGYQIIRNLVKLIFAEMEITSKLNEGTVVKIIITQQ